MKLKFVVVEIKSDEPDAFRSALAKALNAIFPAAPGVEYTVSDPVLSAQETEEG